MDSLNLCRSTRVCRLIEVFLHLPCEAGLTRSLTGWWWYQLRKLDSVDDFRQVDYCFAADMAASSVHEIKNRFMIVVWASLVKACWMVTVSR